MHACFVWGLVRLKSLPVILYVFDRFAPCSRAFSELLTRPGSSVRYAPCARKVARLASVNRALSNGFALSLACGGACGGGVGEVRSPALDPQSEAAALAVPVPGAGTGLQELARGQRGAVSSVERHASLVGVEVLTQGGSAIDAAVAVGFVLAVTHPSAGNLGGGGFMVLRDPNGELVTIDYRESAPADASRDMYLGEAGEVTQQSLVGPLAAGIPGTVAGLFEAHRRYGRLPWHALLMPAIVLAEDGHVVDEAHAILLQRGVAAIHAAGYSDTAALYMTAEGAEVAPGGLWRQPALAATLRRIAVDGKLGFYGGKVAKSLVSAVRSAGGVWTAADLSGYRAELREPLRFAYRGLEVVTMGPPSAGGVVLRQMLGMLAEKPTSKPWRDPLSQHVYLEAARRAYADRNQVLGDPAFVKMPLTRMLAPEYLAERARTIDFAAATPSAAVTSTLVAEGFTPGRARPESPETTHFSVMAADGSAVANTYSLNQGFGSRFAAVETGVLLNNTMDDFAAKPGEANLFGLVQGEANAIAPGKRSLSSMTPTLVLKGRQVHLALGAMGGSTITTTVAQLLESIVGAGEEASDAMRAARLHHQWLPDKVLVEARTDASLREGLSALGHTVETVSYGGQGTIGRAHLVRLLPDGHFEAVADTTREAGYAAAY